MLDLWLLEGVFRLWLGVGETKSAQRRADKDHEESECKDKDVT